MGNCFSLLHPRASLWRGCCQAFHLPHRHRHGQQDTRAPLFGPVTFLEGDGGCAVVRRSLARQEGPGAGMARGWQAGLRLLPPARAPCPAPLPTVSAVLMVCGEEELCFILVAHPAVIKVTSSLLATKDFSPCAALLAGAS